MKLVYKTIIINTIVSVFILFMGEYSLYYFLKHKIEKEALEHLNLERMIMIQELKKGVNIDYFKHNIGDELTITEIPNIQYKAPVITDIEVEEKWEEETFSSKQILFDVQQNQKNYRITISKTIDEDEGLTNSLSVILIISGVCMLGVLVSANVFIYHKLFNPIRKLIKDIKSFSLQQQQKIEQPLTNTQEFVVLGEEISKMSEKLIDDYNVMKEFTENMTHEIQTPLAVINFKIERCLQEKNLTEEQAVLLSDAAKAVNKLFNISKGLNLISRLDNKQYPNITSVNINDLIHHRISYFNDFILRKNITVNEDYENEIIVDMDSSLAEILIDNVLKNAIRHNLEAGSIYIKTHQNSLTISNNGLEPTKPTKDFFNRFSSIDSNKSLGLGLSIVKKIIEYYSYSITYQYSNGLHSIVINFKN